MPPISVALIAGVRLYRDGLASALGAYPILVLSGTAANGSDALPLVEQQRPDVAVIDMAMDDAHGLLRALHAQVPATGLLAFGVREETPSIIDCAEAGAAGYVTLDASLDDLVACIQRVAAGELVCPPRIAAALFRRISKPADTAVGQPTKSLTVREEQVLAYLRRGLTNKEIASALHISEATVKNHLHHLFEKLNVGSRAQAVVRAQVELKRAHSA